MRTAKRYLNGDIQIEVREMKRILLAVLDDRERWSDKATIARDLMLARVTTDDMLRTESERKLIVAMLAEIREISAMLRPSDELSEHAPNLLRRQAG